MPVKKPIIVWVRDIGAILSLLAILWRIDAYFDKKEINDALVIQKINDFETRWENQDKLNDKLLIISFIVLDSSDQ